MLFIYYIFTITWIVDILTYRSSRSTNLRSSFPVPDLLLFNPHSLPLPSPHNPWFSFTFFTVIHCSYSYTPDRFFCVFSLNFNSYAVPSHYFPRVICCAALSKFELKLVQYFNTVVQRIRARTHIYIYIYLSVRLYIYIYLYIYIFIYNIKNSIF